MFATDNNYRTEAVRHKRPKALDVMRRVWVQLGGVKAIGDMRSWSEEKALM